MKKITFNMRVLNPEKHRAWLETLPVESRYSYDYPKDVYDTYPMDGYLITLKDYEKAGIDSGELLDSLGIKFVVHRPLSTYDGTPLSYDWTVSEYTCSAKVIRRGQKTRQDAIAELGYTLLVYMSELITQRQKYIERMGKTND